MKYEYDTNYAYMQKYKNESKLVIKKANFAQNMKKSLTKCRTSVCLHDEILRKGGEGYAISSRKLSPNVSKNNITGIVKLTSNLLVSKQSLFGTAI